MAKSKRRKPAPGQTQAGPEFGLDEPEKGSLPEAEAEPQPQPEAEPAWRDPVAVALTVPCLPVLATNRAYQQTHVDVGLRGRQPRGLRALFDGLVAAQERLESGKKVTAPVDAVRWLLEKLDAAVDANQE